MRRIAAGLFVLAAVVLHAQEHPNDARGFDASKTYDYHGLDAINAFNGNLTITIPIGSAFRANALLGYQLALVYNSHAWSYDEETKDNVTTYHAYPKRGTNAGLGWTLSLGQLIDKDDELNPHRGFWVYEAPDGSQHSFYTDLHDSQTPADQRGFARDSSYLRMRAISTSERQIDLPDGTTRVFKLLKPMSDELPWTESTDSTAVWRLVGITSHLQNTVAIAYTASQTYSERWSISDAGRTITVSFKPTSLSTMPSVLDYVELPKFNGGTARYDFASEQAVVPTPIGAVTQTNGTPAVLLTSVTLPADVHGARATYSMLKDGVPAYDGYNQSGSTRTSGVLTRLTLPTKGSIEWSVAAVHYGNPGTARPPSLDWPVVVTTRKTFQPGASTADGTWQYGRQFGSTACIVSGGSHTYHRQLTTWVMRPRTGGGTPDPQYANVSYFSVYDPETDFCSVSTAEGWDGTEYGLPFTRYGTRFAPAGDPVPSRLLSSQVVQGFTVPQTWDGHGAIISEEASSATAASTTYVHYEVDPDAYDIRDKNPRVSSSATVIDADTGCGTACYTATNSFHFDGFGGYQQESTTGNYPGNENFRTSWKDTNSPNLTGTYWVAGLWSKQCITRDTSARAAVDLATTTPCTGLAVANEQLLTSHAQFDTTTGQLTAKRILSGDGDALSAHDVLSTYTYDARGYVTREQHCGGDRATISTSPEFTCTAPTYQIDYVNTPSTGIVSTRTGTYANGLSTINETYDTGTGLLGTSTDSSGLTTTYSYDGRNRVVAISTPGEVATSIEYGDASYGSSFAPATATVTRQSATDPTSSGLLQQRYEYDAFGRLWREQRVMPSGTATRETRYTATGTRERVSVFEATPSHYTIFSGFDAFDRPGKITTPEDSSGSHPVTLAYAGERQTTRYTWVGTGPTQVSTTETYDARHHTITVADAATETTYTYDTAGRLHTVGLVTSEGTQPRSFTYDHRGFMSSEVHPENGTTTYGNYDAKGHVGTRHVSGTTAFDLTYDYDSAERLTQIAGAGALPLKEYTYFPTSAAPGARGKLASATRQNSGTPGGAVAVKEEYTYNSSGRMASKTTTMDRGDYQPYWTQHYEYNDLGLPSKQTAQVDNSGAPTWDSVWPQYTNGLFTGASVTGATLYEPDFTSSKISYALNGMITGIVHNNGVTDTYTADSSGLPRPSQITFTNWTPPTTCDPPGITSQSNDDTVYYDDPKVLLVTATGDALTYQWYAGQTPITGATGETYQVTTHASGTYWVRVTNGCGHTDSASMTISVALHAPSGLVADRSTATAITVRWQPAAGASVYHVYRFNAGAWTWIGDSAGTTYPDAGLPVNASFLYKATAAATGVVTSVFSNADLESTVLYTTISPGMDVAFTHVNELLTGVNAVRGAAGDLPLTWDSLMTTGCAPGPTPLVGDVIFATHVLALRCATDAALQRLGITSAPYTDAALSGVPIKAQHFTELQQRTDAQGDNR